MVPRMKIGSRRVIPYPCPSGATNLDGFSLLKNLRELENYRNAPLLFMSTDSLVEVEPKALAAGATQCLSKPLDAEYLVDSVQNWSAKAVA